MGARGLDSLKRDWTNKTIQQQHQQLLKAIEEYQAQDLNDLFPWVLERVFGSLDGATVGWGLLQCHEGDAIRKLLQPSGPLMKLTLSLKAYSYDVPLASLPSPVRDSISQAVPALCPVFQDKLRTQSQTLCLSILWTDSFEIHMLYLAATVITQKRAGQQWNVTDGVYFLLVKDYLTHFLPVEASMPTYPSVVETVGDIPLGRSRLNDQSKGRFSVRTRVLLRGQADDKAEHACQDNWASWTMLQVFVGIWMMDFSTEKQCPGNMTEALLPSEAHMLVVRQLLKHLHAFSGQANASPHTTDVWGISGGFLHMIQSKVFSLLQHCFTHWPPDPTFRAPLETWLSYIQPWRYAEHRNQPCKQLTRGVEEHWSHFVQENLRMYSALFRMFLRRASHADLTETSQVLMLYRVVKVFAQPWLPGLIHTGEEQRLCRHLHPPKDLQRSLQQNMTHRAELQDCPLPSMFDSETHFEVLRLLQVIMQAQCSVNQASLVSQPRTWWFSFASKSIPVSRSGRDEVRMSTLKTAELLDRTKLHLCQIFKCSAEMTPGVGATEEEDEEEEEEELPDCVEGENGIILTDLGRMQIINEVRRFRVEYQGDPDLQPVRSYECTLLVELMAWIASHINKQFESQMGTLCSRQDLAGSVCRHLLLSPLNESGRAQKRSPALARPRREQRRGPRVSLRVLASYRTLLCLLLMYLLGCILSWSPLLLCGLVVLLLAVLDPLGPMLIRWSKKCKHVPP